MVSNSSFITFTVVKESPKPIRPTDANNTMGPSEVEAITCDGRQARKNARAQVTIQF